MTRPQETPGAKMQYLIRRKATTSREELIAHWFANHMPGVIARMGENRDAGTPHATHYVASLFDPDAPANVVLERLAEPGELAGWTAPLYRQEGAEQAWYHPQDPTTASIEDRVTSDAEGVDHYRLVSDDRRYAVEVQVFDSGRTDVLAVALLSASSVEELWPAGG